jgi:hypothetical protein
MTRRTSNRTSRINDVGNVGGGETIATPNHDPNFSPVGAPKGTLVRGVLERPWRRKNNISTLDGLMREHARLIKQMHGNKISLEKGEILSRAYGRHREIVAALEQLEELKALHAQLAALRGDPTPLAQLTVDAPRLASPTPAGEATGASNTGGQAGGVFDPTPNRERESCE